MTVYFTSDLHLGHDAVAKMRGFEGSAEHDAVIAERWSQVVRYSDVVYVLGDLALRSPEPALALLNTLPGRKRLILGNHDRAHPMHRDAHRWQRVYYSAFESVSQSARIKVRGLEVLLSHFPYERDRGPSRYLQWRLRDEGLPLLHGHTHGEEKLTVTGDRVEVHVGVDAWDFAPVEDVNVAILASVRTP